MLNPATEEVLATCSTGGVEHIDLAVESAWKAFHGPWSTHDFGRERGQALLRFADLVEKNRASLVAAVMAGGGKPDFEADLEITQVAVAFRYFGQVADKIHGETIPVSSAYLAFTDLAPLGVVGCISPWNFSLQLWAWRCCAALAAGCTVVWKPAEETLYPALQVCPLIAQAFPPGVLNVVNGKGSTIGTHLSKHPRVAKIAFTGSTEVGKTVAQAAASSNLKLVGLELGGKSPVFVLGPVPGGSLADVALTCHHAVMWNAGQCCSAGSRTYIADHLFDEFVKHSVDLAKGKVLGNPSNKGVTMGPVINASQQKSVCQFVTDAKKAPNTKVVYEGQAPAKGFFVAPTIVVSTHESYIAREEIFGPVQVLIRLPPNVTDDQIAHYCNDSRYGLAAAFFGETGRCTRLARRAEAGIIWVNDYNVLGPHIPFGGVKETGGSMDLGLQALRNYTHPRVIVAKL